MPPTSRPRRRGLLDLPGAALVGSVLLIAVVVNAVVLGQGGTMTPTTRSPLPVTMSTLHGTTSITGSTIAQTLNLPLLTTIAIPILDLDRTGSQDWNVQLVVTSASGITGSEAIRFTVLGDATQTLTVSSGTSFPASAANVLLDADGVTISAAPTSALALCGNCAATVELRITSASPSVAGLLFVYPLSFDTL